MKDGSRNARRSTVPMLSSSCDGVAGLPSPSIGRNSIVDRTITPKMMKTDCHG